MNILLHTKAKQKAVYQKLHDQERIFTAFKCNIINRLIHILNPPTSSEDTHHVQTHARKYETQ